MVRPAHHPEPSPRANTNDQNLKFKTDAIVAEHLLGDRRVSVIGISDLDIIWDLGFDNWDFRFVFREAN
jgi:hypothetical protein